MSRHEKGSDFSPDDIRRRRPGRTLHEDDDGSHEVGLPEAAAPPLPARTRHRHRDVATHDHATAAAASSGGGRSPPPETEKKTPDKDTQKSGHKTQEHNNNKERKESAPSGKPARKTSKETAKSAAAGQPSQTKMAHKDEEDKGAKNKADHAAKSIKLDPSPGTIPPQASMKVRPVVGAFLPAPTNKPPPETKPEAAKAATKETKETKSQAKATTTKTEARATRKVEIPQKIKDACIRRGFEINKTLGRGAFSTVVRATAKIDKEAKKIKKGDYVALKLVSLETDPANKMRMTAKELNTFKNFNHEFAVDLKEYFRTAEPSYCIIIMEYCSNGNLQNYCRKNGPIHEKLAGFWFNQLCDVMIHMHRIPAVHRDIKLENILLDHKYNAKISDYSFARLLPKAVDPDKKIVFRTFCGTAPYYSPQIIQRRQYDPFKLDVWCAGVVLYTMACNEYPFHFYDEQVKTKGSLQLEEQKAQYFRHKDSYKRLSTHLRALIELLLAVDENVRPAFEQVREQDWCKKYEARPKARYMPAAPAKSVSASAPAAAAAAAAAASADGTGKRGKARESPKRANSLDVRQSVESHHLSRSATGSGSLGDDDDDDDDDGENLAAANDDDDDNSSLK